MSKKDKTESNVIDVKFRANSDVTAAWVNGKLLFTFRDLATMTFNPALVAQANRSHAELHGWEQRLRDSMAIEKDNYPDKKVPLADRKAALRRLLDHYQSGATEWNMPQAARNTAPDAAMVALAISRVYGKTLDEAAAMIVALAQKRSIEHEAAVAAWAAGDKIAKEIVVIRSERKTADAPASDDLLAELNG